eukprot:1703756-Heterocapsa_arctica.AAC.1
MRIAWRADDHDVVEALLDLGEVEQLTIRIQKIMVSIAQDVDLLDDHVDVRCQMHEPCGDVSPPVAAGEQVEHLQLEVRTLA